MGLYISPKNDFPFNFSISSLNSSSATEKSNVDNSVGPNISII